jgi:hypothetical protein
MTALGANVLTRSPAAAINGVPCNDAAFVRIHFIVHGTGATCQGLANAGTTTGPNKVGYPVGPTNWPVDRVDSGNNVVEFRTYDHGTLQFATFRLQKWSNWNRPGFQRTILVDRMTIL